jgi:hypothetical protein
MIKSKKGIESFPFFLFLMLFIAAFVITISFYQIQIFSSFSSHKDLSDTYTRMINAMETLQSTSDKGSFTSVVLDVPSGYNITISAANNTITINGGGTELINAVKFDIINVTNSKGEVTDKLYLESGNYQIVVYYGEPGNKTEPYEIFFV